MNYEEEEGKGGVASKDKRKTRRKIGKKKTQGEKSEIKCVTEGR